MKILYKEGDGWYQDNDWELWGKMGINTRQSVPVMYKEALREMERVTDAGGLKHGYGSWLNKGNPSLQHKANFASIFRHVSEAYCGIKEDKDTGIDPRLHAAVRLLMSYTRDIRGISDSHTRHEDEEVPGYEGLVYEDYAPGGPV